MVETSQINGHSRQELSNKYFTQYTIHQLKSSVRECKDLYQELFTFQIRQQTLIEFQYINSQSNISWTRDEIPVFPEKKSLASQDRKPGFPEKKIRTQKHQKNFKLFFKCRSMIQTSAKNFPEKPGIFFLGGQRFFSEKPGILSWEDRDFVSGSWNIALAVDILELY